MSEQLIPIRKVAELAPFASRTTLHRWIHSGFLEARRIGHRWYTTQSAINRVLQGEKPQQPKN